MSEQEKRPCITLEEIIREEKARIIYHRRLNRKLGRILGRNITKDLSWELISVKDGSASWFSIKKEDNLEQMAITKVGNLIIGATVAHNWPEGILFDPGFHRRQRISLYLLDNYPSSDEVGEKFFNLSKLFSDPRSYIEAKKSFTYKKDLEKILSKK